MICLDSDQRLYVDSHECLPLLERIASCHPCTESDMKRTPLAEWYHALPRPGLCWCHSCQQHVSQQLEVELSTFTKKILTFYVHIYYCIYIVK